MKNVKFSRNGVEFEPTKQELKIVLDDFAKQLGERDKRLADLEKELQDWQDGTIIAQWQDCEQRVKDLEKQLAEKDKAHMEAMGNALSDFLTLRQELNQAKTDFAIEQLESVKEHISSGLAFDIDVQIWFEEYIDQQIKELKGEANV